jgi:hypothetical protein
MIPFVAVDHEVGHGRESTWTLLTKQVPRHISEVWIRQADACCNWCAIA